MAFSAEELRVLRCALAIASKSTAEPQPQHEECHQLAQDVEAATREGSRLRSFLLADLARHRAALPGSATGYLEQLEDALAAGYLPRPDDLAALRMLCAEAGTDGNGHGGDGVAGVDEAERQRRAELLERGERLAEQAVRARLLVLPGGRSASPDERVPGAADRTAPGTVSSTGASAGFGTTEDPDAEVTAGEVRPEQPMGECAVERTPEHDSDRTPVRELPAPGEPEPDRDAMPCRAVEPVGVVADGGREHESGPEREAGPERRSSPGGGRPEPSPVEDAPAEDADPPDSEPAPSVPTPAEVFPPRRHPTEPHQEALLA